MKINPSAKKRYKQLWALSGLTLVAVWTMPYSIVAGATSQPTNTSLLLRLVTDIPLPGSASRMDYQSFDPKNGLLYISHMDAGQIIVFDTRTNKVIANLNGFPGVTGVLAVPSLNRVYASVTGKHQIAIIDQQSLKVEAWVSGADFPDGIAYAPEAHKIFVSDEFDGKDIVIDSRTNQRLDIISLGGQAGNTHYDPVSGNIFVAVQSLNEMDVIDPHTDTVIGRYPLPGGDGPHGFYIDAPQRVMFVSCENDGKLLVVDMHTMQVLAVHSVGASPDVLAFDPILRRLYVGSESGIVSIFQADGMTLKKIGELHMPHAHTVAVVPALHQVYFPLQDMDGQPTLRIMAEQQPDAKKSSHRTRDI